MWQWNDYNDLYHHGILGMKWGKRNGPPYPLAPGDHSASEKKAGWRNSLSDNQKKVLKTAAIAAVGGAAIYGAMKYSDMRSNARPAVELGIKFVSTFDKEPQKHTVESIVMKPLRSISIDQMDEAQRYTMELLNRNNEMLRKMGY